MTRHQRDNYIAMNVAGLDQLVFGDELVELVRDIETARAHDDALRPRRTEMHEIAGALQSVGSAMCYAMPFAAFERDHDQLCIRLRFGRAASRRQIRHNFGIDAVSGLGLG